jgi:hypothetical protein
MIPEKIIEFGGCATAYRLTGGEYHRTDGPASIWSDGVCGWYLFGKYHRYYGPQDVDDSWWLHGTQLK